MAQACWSGIGSGTGQIVSGLIVKYFGCIFLFRGAATLMGVVFFQLKISHFRCIFYSSFRFPVTVEFEHIGQEEEYPVKLCWTH